MAAGQQKKRLNAASYTILNSIDQPLRKKKKFGSPLASWNLRPHISLVWDDTSKKAVARRDQIGISWRELLPYVKPPSSSTSGLADVFSVPEEIFQLDNLNEVLSYEVWEMYLSESERDLLIQFLPRVKDADEVVHPLLMGENMHFGNPLDNWSACLLSGKLHPDAVLHQNQQLKANKNKYYDQIEAYHEGLLKCLFDWKGRWESCKDPVKEIVERIWRKGLLTANHSNSPISSELARAMTSENGCDACGDHRNASRHISYIKISRREHQLAKNIRSAGDGILPKSLSRVLGDFKGKMQPYEEFEEDESRRLHEYWLKLAHQDVPLAVEEFRRRRIWNQNRVIAIQHEMLGKLTKTMKEVEKIDGCQCSAVKLVESTKCKENHELWTGELASGTENGTSEGTDVEFSDAERVNNSKSEQSCENFHQGPSSDVDSEESEGDGEFSAQQLVDTFDSKFSKGSPDLLDSEKDDGTQKKDSSEEKMGKLGHQQPDDSLTKQQYALRHLESVCSPPKLLEDHKMIPSLNLGNLSHQQADKSLPQQSDLSYLDKVCSQSKLHEDLKRNPTLNGHRSELVSDVFDCVVIEDESKLEADAFPIHKKLNGHLDSPADVYATKTSTGARNLEKIPSLNRNPDTADSLTPYHDTHGELQDSSGKLSVMSHFPDNLVAQTNILNPQDPAFSAKDPWGEVGIQNPYSAPPGCNVFPFVDGSSCNGSNRAEQPNPAVNLGGKLLMEENTRSENEASVCHSYASMPTLQNIHMPPLPKNQNLVAPPFSKEQLLRSYTLQQFNNAKMSNLPIFGQNCALPQHPMYQNNFNRQRNTFQEQKHVFQPTSPTGDKELYIQQMTNKANFSSGRAMGSGRNGGIESPDWLAFTAGNIGSPGNNLFSSELQPRNGWSAMEPSMGTGPPLSEGRSADGSLFSILPECSRTPHRLSSNLPNSGRLTFPGNFAPEIVPDVGAFSNSSYEFARSQCELDNSRSHEAFGLTVPPNGVTSPWVNFPPHNPNLSSGFLGKSNTRTWKQ